MSENTSIGFYVKETHDPNELLIKVRDKGFKFIIAPFCSPDTTDFNPFCDLTLTTSEWRDSFVAKVVYTDFEQNLFQARTEIEKQIDYGSHLGVKALLFDLPRNEIACANLAAILNGKMNPDGGLGVIPSIWINVDLNNRTELAPVQGLENEIIYEDLWVFWNRFRRMIMPSRRFGILLELSTNSLDEPEIARWAGEPIKAIQVGTHCFISNRHNFPVLSKTQKQLIIHLRDKTAWNAELVLKTDHEDAQIEIYAQYLKHLHAMTDLTDLSVTYGRGYEDFLQLPLQPLSDNLESSTYEIFEKDPVKYESYREAIKAVMLSKSEQKEFIVLVVGAGRGPLVHATMQAAASTSKFARIYAVEKNMNAIYTLRSLHHKMWGGDAGLSHAQVQVFAGDMRDWVAPEKAHIVVSELLGSFGDNELSPECLDGVWRNVNSDCVSIPCEYTSYIAPIMSHKLYTETAFSAQADKPSYAPFECLYVSYLRNFYTIDTHKKLFTFEHYSLDQEPNSRDNRRFGKIKFIAKMDACLHGFAGYFNAKLFGDLTLSILPGEETKSMFSWFPLWIPLSQPIDVQKGQEIEICVWRNVNKHRVWYEWALMSPQASQIHNSNGRSQHIGL